MANIILIRHGRNDYHGVNQGELNAAGRMYAGWLRRLYPIQSRRAQIRGVFSSRIARNQDTVRGIAADLNVDVVTPNGWQHRNVLDIVRYVVGLANEDWYVIACGSQDLEQFADGGYLPGCERMVQRYEIFMTFSDRVNGTYNTIETWHFNALLYGRDVVRAIQQH